MRKPTKFKRKAVHLQNLAAVFGYTLEGITFLYRHLKINETHGRKLNEQYCNGEIDADEYESRKERIKKNLLATLRDARSEVVRNIYLNGDPRGYFIKINDSYVRDNKLQIETDWGGYGIVCPEDV
jgi:hypothetical protein